MLKSMGFMRKFRNYMQRHFIGKDSDRLGQGKNTLRAGEIVKTSMMTRRPHMQEKKIIMEQAEWGKNSLAEVNPLMSSCNFYFSY